MPSNKLKLVVDADIARSSGTTEHPISSNARILLDMMMSNGHYIVMCPTLNAEWKKHRSNYATRWFASMIAKKKVKFIRHNNTTHKVVETLTIDEKTRSVALKDCHLIDIALCEDKIIASNDNNARIAFCAISKLHGEIKPVAWLHSVNDNDFLTSLLDSNCFIPQKYKLN